MSKKRRNHSPAFKVKVALTLKGDATLSELSQQFGINDKKLSQTKNA